MRWFNCKESKKMATVNVRIVATFKGIVSGEKYYVVGVANSFISYLDWWV